MTHKDVMFTTKDAMELVAHVWPVQTTPCAKVLLVHGMGEHYARYAHVAQALNQVGFLVMGYDQRGHGRSPGKRGDTPGLDVLLDDIGQALDQLDTLGEGPTFLYGHSMGGNLVINYALKPQAQRLQGVVATSPWLMLPKKQQRLVRLAGMLAKVLPTISINNGIDPVGLSRDAQVVQAYQEDPLNHDKITPRMAAALGQGGMYALDHAQQLRVPMLLMHGEDDPITLCTASRHFYQQAPPGRCEFVPWPHNLHELHNDLDQNQAIERIITFLQTHCTNRPSRQG